MATQAVQDQFRKDIEDGVWVFEPVTGRISHRVEMVIGTFDAKVYIRGDRHMLAAAARFELLGRQA